jgi:predicted DNA-binding transcriptional regulator AlpA
MDSHFYPNRPLLFAATLATFATLTARKITLDGRTCPNLYTVAVALSGVGKDAGNSLSTAILRSAGMGHCAQFEFGSAESIEDALCDISPAILWVCDEIDEWIGSTKNENNRGGTSNLKVRRLLQLYAQSKSSIFRRAKARAYGRRKGEDAPPPEEIHMPHLSLYGTCTPKGFFSAFSERIAGGGFLGRMLIFEGDRRGLRRRPTASAVEPPKPLAEIARFWAEHPCGVGNLASAMPDPKRVPFAPGAEDLDDEHAHYIDRELFEKREAVHDNVGGSIYARTAEYARKLALLYAASADPRNSVVGADAVRWGWDLSIRQSRRLIALMGRHAADTPFQELCLRVLNRLRDARGKPVTRSELLRLTRAKKADFDSAVETLNERREIQAVQIRTKTKTADGYRLRLRQKTPT